jgi:two-component system, cell cycle response regulator
MEKVVDTVFQPSRRPLSTKREACLVHIYPTGPLMGIRHVLGERPVTIGRGEDCDIRILDNSVSRRHARIEHLDDGFHVLDMQSTNGTFVNDFASKEGSSILLKDGDYLRVGNCIYRFLAGGNVEAEYHEEIYRLTIIDALTQIHNQRYLMEFLEREVLRTSRHGRPLSLLMFDIDRFKTINDEMGHLVGDYTLRELAACVRKMVRREDLFSRYGGEEFVVVLVETNRKQALEAAERIRLLVEKYNFRFEEQAFNLTVSIGVAECPTDGSASALELIKKADENLYEAKHAGRNRVMG